MKKLRLLLSIGALLDIALIIYAAIYFQNEILPRFGDDEYARIFARDTILFIVTIVSLLLLLFFAAFYYTTRKNKVNQKLAYWNAELGMFNDNMFVLTSKKRIAKHYGRSAIMSFNIIGFKSLSVQFGYEFGNMVLNSVATILKEKYDPKKVVYAYNMGDTFSVFRPYLDEKECSDDIIDIEEKVNKLVFELGLNTEIKMALGICLINDKTLKFEEYVRRANIARLSVKNETSDRTIYFSESLLNNTLDDIEMTNQIDQAIKKREFVIYYQPKFDVKLNRFIGAEALIRWNHPTKGFVTPGSFIPFAERNGQIVQLGRYVFEQVCHDIAEWKKNGQRLVTVSVNISRVELYQSDLLTFFVKTINHYRVNPMLIEIELTESVASKDLIFATVIMKKIRALKFKVALDDFGTGYSSLSYLKNIPIDTLKLDKSFFDDIEIDAKSRDIVRLVVELAKALNLYIVAEGIQSAKQIQYIKTTKCDAVQGYFYSEALPKEEFDLLLRKNKFE